MGMEGVRVSGTVLRSRQDSPTSRGAPTYSCMQQTLKVELNRKVVGKGPADTEAGIAATEQTCCSTTCILHLPVAWRLQPSFLDAYLLTGFQFVTTTPRYFKCTPLGITLEEQSSHSQSRMWLPTESVVILTWTMITHLHRLLVSFPRLIIDLVKILMVWILK